MLGIDGRILRAAWTVFLFVLLLGILWWIRATLGVFAAAIFFAYMLSPLVELVERFIKKRRTLALSIVYVGFIGLLVSIGFQLIPILAEQAVSLAGRLPELTAKGKLTQFPLPSFLEPLREQVAPMVNRAATSLEASVVPLLREAGSRLLSGLGQLLPIVLVPILAFFFLKDARSMRRVMVNSVDEPDHRQMLDRILTDVHDVLRKYIRALALLSVASFAAWGLFLSVFKYPYELLLAGISAVLEFIPVVGPVTALAAVCIVCLATGTGGLLWIILFWALFRLFQDYVLQPYLMSSGVELHPVLVLFGVLAGEALGGVPGMFFSIPALAILRLIVQHAKQAHSAQLQPDVDRALTPLVSVERI